MSNVLKMAKIQSIQQLHALGWSQRRIAVELQIDRGTVAQHVQPPPPGSKNRPLRPPARSGSKAANFLCPAGSQRSLATDGSNRRRLSPASSNAAIPPTGLPAGKDRVPRLNLHRSAWPAQPVRTAARVNLGKLGQAAYRRSGSGKTSRAVTASAAGSTRTSGSCVKLGSATTAALPPDGVRTWRRGPSRFRHRCPDRSPLTASGARPTCFASCSVTDTQGLQRGDVHPHDRRLLSLPGKRLQPTSAASPRRW